MHPPPRAIRLHSLLPRWPLPAYPRTHPPARTQHRRLYLAAADIQADRGRWAEAAEAATRAAWAASDTTPSGPAEALLIAEVELVAACSATRAFLVQNSDADAFRSAQQARKRGRTKQRRRD